MFVTSLFQVNGAAEPSSKNEWGIVAVCVRPSGGFVNEVVEGPMTGIEVTPVIDKFGLEKGSACDRVVGDMPLIESIDVAGDTPSETKDRRFRGKELLEANMSGSPSISEAELPSDSSSSSCI
jgi:hypothetical protein